MKIAIVDLSRDLSIICEQISTACKTSGCFYVINHGIPDQLIRTAFDQMKLFFALPLETKQKYSLFGKRFFGRGYVPFQAENVAKYMGRTGEPNDLVEKFNITNVDPLPNDLANPNPSDSLPWPSPDLPEFRTVYEEYFRSCQALAKRLFYFFEVTLGVPEESFSRELAYAGHGLNCNYYRAVDPGSDNPVRLAEHTDACPLAILAQDETKAALKVKLKSGEWVDADPIPGGLFINIGEIMARWTNDIWVATPHKVMLPEKKEGEAQNVPDRSSIVFFVMSRSNCMVSCVPSCREATGGVEKYPPISYGDWMAQRINKLIQKT
jgi:isopenicillin N synthase-like dioxygenase